MTGNHLTLHSPCSLQKRIDTLNKNTPGIQKSKAKSEAPVSYLNMYSTKNLISDGGQGLSGMQEYHISMVNT